MAIQWDASWNQNQQKKETVKGALNRIEAMLTKAYLSVKAVDGVQDQKNIYVQHFNDNALNNLANVTNIIKLMHERVTKNNQTMTMSYVPDETAFNNLGVGNLPNGVDMDDVEAFVIQNGVPANTALTVYIGPSFFTGNVYIQKSVNERSGTGTILHELSHGVGNTADHAYTWDNANYSNLTANQLADNADTYRAYCQTFDNLI